MDEIVEIMNEIGASSVPQRLPEFKGCTRTTELFIASNNNNEFVVSSKINNAEDWWKRCGVESFEVCESTCIRLNIPNGNEVLCDATKAKLTLDRDIARLRNEGCKCKKIEKKRKRSASDRPKPIESMSSEVENWVNAVSRRFETHLHAMIELTNANQQLGLHTTSLRSLIDHAFSVESQRVRHLVDFALDNSKPDCSLMVIDDTTMDNLLHMDMIGTESARQRKLSLAMSRGRFRFRYSISRTRNSELKTERRTTTMTRGHFCDFLLSFNPTARHIFRLLATFTGMYGDMRLTSNTPPPTTIASTTPTKRRRSDSSSSSSSSSSSEASSSSRVAN